MMTTQKVSGFNDFLSVTAAKMFDRSTRGTQPSSS